ncbi:SDR family oxidoreductase [Citrobacter sp. JGM124]|uniref:SDR family oxidoreductase n=1 Tax=Citrobacter sp. JGM124 TaxID=2799789 RepID=UPI001BAB6D6A|nr:SDR family oxidoreductase [Citrobacter sp. JGM124]MBS0849172.1 SDR family oxidoreductase [Citrobacter sp. JGM124]
MLAITGASGQLGRLVIEQLLTKVPAEELVAVVRNPARVSDLAQAGVQVRTADYNDVAALTAAFSGVEKVLLISSSEVGQRVAQHRHVIEAAKKAGVKLIAYTSLLHATNSPLGLAAEHVATEQLLSESGIPFVLLRNGWYSENYLASLPPALQHGVFIGSAGEGKIAAAPRADYAAAAASVLTLDNQNGKVYELAGDDAWTLTELVAEISRQTGTPLHYQNLSEADFKAALLSAGLPEGLAAMLADSDIGASKGGLFDGQRQLSQLIGHPTEALSISVKKALVALNGG